MSPCGCDGFVCDGIEHENTFLLVIQLSDKLTVRVPDGGTSRADEVVAGTEAVRHHDRHVLLLGDQRIVDIRLGHTGGRLGHAGEIEVGSQIRRSLGMLRLQRLKADRGGQRVTTFLDQCLAVAAHEVGEFTTGKTLPRSPWSLTPWGLTLGEYHTADPGWLIVDASWMAPEIWPRIQLPSYRPNERRSFKIWLPYWVLLSICVGVLVASTGREFWSQKSMTNPAVASAIGECVWE